MSVNCAQSAIQRRLKVHDEFFTWEICRPEEGGVKGSVEVGEREGFGVHTVVDGGGQRCCRGKYHVSRNANNQGNTHEKTNMFLSVLQYAKCMKLLKLPIRKKVQHS